MTSKKTEAIEKKEEALKKLKESEEVLKEFKANVVEDQIKSMIIAVATQ